MPILRAVRRAIAGALGVLVAACAVGPDYHRPPAEVPPRYQPEAPWAEASPADALLKGNWWELFQDPALSPLVARALDANQNLKVAAARLDQARAQLLVARADLYPTVAVGASADRARSSANRPLSSYSTPNQSTVQNDFRIGPLVSYELDLFGRVRRQAEGARASAEEAQANYENARLVLVADLATSYFSLRATDAEIEVVQRSLDLQRDALTFVQSRHDLGFATGLDLAEQQALVEASATQLELLQNQRAQSEHAIATLTGTPAPAFQLGSDPAAKTLPQVPPGLPADLLQRRPDVAAAERAMAAANARIGVAKAAYFPNIQLLPGAGAAATGYESNTLSSLFGASSLLWSVGLSAGETLFDAGRIRGNVRFARADYEASVAGYRQTVLTAMEEVQNGITGLQFLARAAQQADASVQSARKAYELASERYKGGVAIYLDVLTAQQTLLSNERQAVQIRGQQFATTVFLVKALGGGWQAAAAG